MKNNHILKLFIIGLVIIPIFSFAQEFTIKQSPEEIQRKKELKEELEYLKFQTRFFEALHLKAKEDYTQAIAVLEDCKQIYPEDPGMNFEFAKNYYLLKDYENAIFFNKKTLEYKPNVNVLEHLKKIYRSQQDMASAIGVQKQIIALKPERKAELIILYIGNNEREKAKKLLLELEDKNELVDNTSYYKRILFTKKTKKAIKKYPIGENPNKKEEDITVDGMRKQFQKKKKYKILKKLLIQENKLNKFKTLAEDSKSGLELFPAQPYLYFMQGKAQNKLYQHKDALLALFAGLDFIIDNNKLEADFYEQIHLAYLGLKNNKEATKYLNKALSLRNVN